ncbi:AraC family transcriptional regulator [Gluconacetobacter sacchari DSM 12717]|uniref:Helix-turn-helix domain-containing protein n=2 Tax=Gluconacetobacter sacchari TaxID=92759 RepID=A0A7W4IAT7_9PROT|nr:helix-turn-helix domain-containing protein [Gluconacetobacter sacchari]MBB2159383.1 helix-turn-helix domain-containing protein [Gluconacetobacter sacchari]GBQ20528.1 AraC family transcriptional regulator [Gluconacetobacter sacchari DSM 12717]
MAQGLDSTTHVFFAPSFQESGLPLWNQRYIQLGKGTFKGTVSVLTFGKLTLIEETINVSVGQTTCPPDGTIAVVLPAHHHKFGTINGEARSDKAFVHVGGREITVSGEENCRAYYVLARQADLPGFDFRKFGAITPIEPSFDVAQMSAWLASIFAGTWLPEVCLSGQADQVLSDILLDRVKDILTDILQSADFAPLRGTFSYSLFLKAQRFIDDYNDAIMSVSRLTEELNVPPHILRSAFVQTTGVSPRLWLRQRALDRARRAMLDPVQASKGVSQIALECGFFHFGRFAGYYAETYGELPIVTIRNTLST